MTVANNANSNPPSANNINNNSMSNINPSSNNIPSNDTTSIIDEYQSKMTKKKDDKEETTNGLWNGWYEVLEETTKTSTVSSSPEKVVVALYKDEKEAIECMETKQMLLRNRLQKSKKHCNGDDDVEDETKNITSK
eukprot:13176502-Ditylum_brightwellii.AAC.1